MHFMQAQSSQQGISSEHVLHTHSCMLPLITGATRSRNLKQAGKSSRTSASSMANTSGLSS